jgi:chaperone required for assembly of F1-ATPase
MSGASTAGRSLPRRFHVAASIRAEGDGHTVLLDGRPVRTPAKAPLVVPTAALATAIAAEWDAQGERIDPATMPLTRLANSTIDTVTPNRVRLAEEVVAYAGCDALCYRAEAPAGLVRRQQQVWDPILAAAERALGAPFAVSAGIVHRAQSPTTLEAVRRAVDACDPWRLAAVHVMTTLAGSAVLALAVADGRLDVDAAWEAAHVDEDWQIAQWGVDAEATARRARRRSDMTAAARLLETLR